MKSDKISKEETLILLKDLLKACKELDSLWDNIEKRARGKDGQRV